MRMLFSDVDGTVLDRTGHYAMNADEVAPYLCALTIVLASSRTILELSRNQRDLGILGPVVAENGAVVALPWHEQLESAGVREEIDGRSWCVLTLGLQEDVLRADVQEAARTTGTPCVDQCDVEPTLGRRCSVLLRPIDGAHVASLAPLASALRAQGHSVASGGDWLAVTGGADKGRGAHAVIELLATLGARPAIVGAVGDGDNDVPLLHAVEHRFVIARDDGTWHPALRDIPGVSCIDTPGIAGWREVIPRMVMLQGDDRQGIGNASTEKV